jgi:hypothetical protein
LAKQRRRGARLQRREVQVLGHLAHHHPGARDVEHPALGDHNEVLRCGAPSWAGKRTT